MTHGPYYEVNFDGLPGPTHNYSGLSYGNVASIKNKNLVSNPKQAALQCLHKMHYLSHFGLYQGVIPPHDRPNIAILKNLGFHGSDKAILQKAYKEHPEIFFACCSSSAMWTANAATVTPSPDAEDRRVHFTPANLSYEFHRSFEYHTTALILKRIFANPTFFAHHYPLHPGRHFSDEGAANHTRFCKSYGEPGISLFVYGKHSFKQSTLAPVRYPARQTFEASQAITRKHLMQHENIIFAQQSPKAIDAGVFHNDVISIGNCNLFMYHESAFVGTPSIIQEIDSKVRQQCNCSMIFIPVTEKQISLKDAVNTYLFNSQIINVKDGHMALIVPQECQETPTVNHFIEELIHDPENPIQNAYYVNLKESMQNGGGPACLRLRVVLSQNEIEALTPGTLLNNKLFHKLTAWVNKHYRDRLAPADLCDPQLLLESRHALDELTQILNLGPIYPFQRNSEH